MSTIVREVKLILTEVGVNSNKFWYGRLYDNDDVETEWGRVGYSSQSKHFAGRGERFLNTKVAEKTRKGYSELQIIAEGAKTVDVTESKLQTIAKKQIVTTDPIVAALIEQLAKANVHKITSSTNITFNAEAGTFMTPLGVVTIDAIEKARELLLKILGFVQIVDYTDDGMVQATNQYLRLIPQNVGRKLDLHTLFPGEDAVKKQFDILDSLEASYKACSKKPEPVDGEKTEEEPEEKVFAVKMEPVTDDELKEIKNKYAETRQSIHAASKLEVLRAYRIEIDSMTKAFKTGKKVGNVKQLWHGTSESNLLSILKSGLRISPPSSARITGKMFGEGTYFSDQSSKSLNYSFGTFHGVRNNHCFMFLANVAMGNEYVPKGSYEDMPKKGYDSTFAKAGISGVINNEMIIYADNQANLEYLVEFSTK